MHNNRCKICVFKNGKIVIFNIENEYSPVKNIDYEFPNGNYFSLSFSPDERLLAMDPGQPGSHYGNARQLSPRRGLRALQGPSFDIFTQNEVDTQGPGQDLRHPDAGTAHGDHVLLESPSVGGSRVPTPDKDKASQAFPRPSTTTRSIKARVRRLRQTALNKLAA